MIAVSRCLQSVMALTTAVISPTNSTARRVSSVSCLHARTLQGHNCQFRQFVMLCKSYFWLNNEPKAAECIDTLQDITGISVVCLPGSVEFCY